jgi:hypothetical protein
MSRGYNIVERLRAANERPFITVADGKTYVVNTSKTTALHIEAINGDDKLSDMEKLDKLVFISLGEKAFKEIEKMDISMEALLLLVEAITAAIAGEELEEVKERFQEVKEAK